MLSSIFVLWALSQLVIEAVLRRPEGSPSVIHIPNCARPDICCLIYNIDWVVATKQAARPSRLLDDPIIYADGARTMDKDDIRGLTDALYQHDISRIGLFGCQDTRISQNHLSPIDHQPIRVQFNSPNRDETFWLPAGEVWTDEIFSFKCPAGHHVELLETDRYPVSLTAHLGPRTTAQCVLNDGLRKTSINLFIRAFKKDCFRFTMYVTAAVALWQLGSVLISESRIDGSTLWLSSKDGHSRAYTIHDDWEWPYPVKAKQQYRVCFLNAGVKTTALESSLMFSK